ncbi:MAG: tryptophan synthase subunit alpha [Bacteroidales bacterium]
MNRIDELFLRKQKSVLSVYFTAGYPELTDTGLIISGLEKAGADLIEIGFPFSDPVADGPVIQASSHQALLNGMNLDILFDQLRELKETSRIPKIMMGYFNTVYQFKVDRFINQCVECGIDGVIIPDLPPEVYEKDYRELFESAGIHFICLVAPQTSSDRAKYLASLSRGFIYLLSSSSTTGGKYSPVREDLRVLPSRFSREADGFLPTLIGFGIHDHETFEMACRHANGAIIGTGFIRWLTANLKRQEKGHVTKDVRQQQINILCENFVDQIRG